MELDASMLRPIVGQALDAAVAVTVDWSVVPILAGDGQGLGVFRVSSSGRVGDAPRVWSLILKVLPGIRRRRPSGTIRRARRSPTNAVCSRTCRRAPRCFGYISDASPSRRATLPKTAR